MTAVKVEHDNSPDGKDCVACHPELAKPAIPVILKTLTFQKWNDAEAAFDSAIELGLDVEWQEPGTLHIARTGKVDEENTDKHVVKIFAPTVE